MAYEKLQQEAEQHGICIYERSMHENIKGLYGDNIIWINKFIQTTTEKACILAEELGHHFTSAGVILDQTKLENRKQEKRARTWAYEKLVPLNKIVQASKQGVHNRFELAEFMGVTESFLAYAIERYQEKYGLSVSLGKYIIHFNPLSVTELAD